MNRIAIVHDWLVAFGGAETVLEQLFTIFPDADLFCVVDFLPENQRQFLAKKRVTTSFVQRLPFARKKYRQYLPLMPFAVQQFDLSAYDLVLTSSHAVAKGVKTNPEQLHICLCYTPMRYAWDMQTSYLQLSGLNQGFRGWAARWMLRRLRDWDARTSKDVDEFIAISQFIAERIQTSYKRKATVIYPPVDVSKFTLREDKEDFYLAASRLVPYKRMDLIVEAFAVLPDRNLKVIGDGPELSKIISVAGPNVEILGYQEFAQLRDYMQRARAFIFAAEEDFGIMPLEAQACGTPVIAFGKGASLETVRGLGSARPTGVFFHAQKPAAIVDAIKEFEGASISPHLCRENALRFSVARFRDSFKNFVTNRYREWEIGRMQEQEREIERVV